jgi:hypothetical protein
MVNEMRVPSSSSSDAYISSRGPTNMMIANSHTDCDWLNFDTLFNVCGCWIIGILVIEHSLAAECVNEGSSACGKSQ